MTSKPTFVAVLLLIPMILPGGCTLQKSAPFTEPPPPQLFNDFKTHNRVDELVMAALKTVFSTTGPGAWTPNP